MQNISKQVLFDIEATSDHPILKLGFIFEFEIGYGGGVSMDGNQSGRVGIFQSQSWSNHVNGIKKLSRVTYQYLIETKNPHGSRTGPESQSKFIILSANGQDSLKFSNLIM